MNDEYNYKTIMNVLDISVKSAYNKMYGVTDYTMQELIKLKKHYQITFDELLKIIEQYRKN